MQRDSLVTLAHALIRGLLRPGDRAVDGTAGNGHDTAFLARQVGETGLVTAFDVQRAALDRTRARLGPELASRVRLIRAGHESMARHVGDSVRVVMFNLGYLPGAGREIITRPETTLTGLRAAMTLLAPGGRISLLAYVGHPGGRLEADAVLDCCVSLQPPWQWRLVNPRPRNATAPRLVVIDRVAETP